jgi:hypothetical protein
MVFQQNALLTKFNKKHVISRCISQPTSIITTRRTEQVNIAVTLQTCIQEVLGSNSSRDTGYLVIFRFILQRFQENSGIVPRLSHDRFLSNAFQFIIHHPFHHPMPYILDTSSIVK